MTIPFTGTGGLFTRLGASGQVIADIQALIGNNQTLPTDITNLLNQYEGSNVSNAEPDLVALVNSQANASKLAIVAFDSALQQVAAQTVARMVFRDNPINSRTNALTNLQEVIRQMQATNQTVQRCNITATAAAFSSYTNSGNGNVVLSTKRGDGLIQENAFAEVARLVCTADSQGGGVKFQETFQFQGTEAQTNPFHFEWPLGSGASATMQSVDAGKNNSGGNLLTNSSWTNFTSNLPNNWVDQFGNAGVDFFKESVQVYGVDANALKFIGGTGHAPSLTQQFNLAAGTVGALKADSVYHWNSAFKCNFTAGSGVFIIELVDSNNDPIFDDQGVANQLTIPMSTIGTQYAFISAVFRTPKLLPSSARIRYRVSIPLVSTHNLFCAHTALSIVNPVYTGGPNISVFSGGIPWIKNDKFNVTVTNDRGGSVNQKTFQTLFDRLFSMRLNNLLLPSGAPPTISDTLI